RECRGFGFSPQLNTANSLGGWGWNCFRVSSKPCTLMMNFRRYLPRRHFRPITAAQIQIPNIYFFTVFMFQIASISSEPWLRMPLSFRISSVAFGISSRGNTKDSLTRLSNSDDVLVGNISQDFHQVPQVLDSNAIYSSDDLPVRFAVALGQLVWKER